MTKRWTENQTYQFVKIYLKRESLWNPNNDEYRLRDKRVKAYREIIAEFKSRTGIELHEAQLRMKARNLMSTYAQEKAKIKQRSNSEWTYKPNMKWFSEWHKCIMRRNGLSEAETSLDSQSQELTELPNPDSCQKVWLTENDEENAEDESVSLPDDDYNILVLKSESYPESRDVLNTGSSSRYETKKKKAEPRSPSTDHSDTTFRGSMSSEIKDRSIKEEDNREDEFDIYGKYIASQLRKMDMQKALRVKLEIHTLVSEARISEIGQ